MKTLLIELMNWFQLTGYRKASFDRLLGILVSAKDYNEMTNLIEEYDQYLRPATLKGGFPGVALRDNVYPYRVLQEVGSAPVCDTPLTYAPAIPCPVLDPIPVPAADWKEVGITPPAPTVTTDAIAAEVVSEHYRNLGSALKQPEESPTHNVTLCVLVLRNGFVMVGKSACVNSENFNEELGKRFAREDAVRQIWPLLGFRMADARIFPIF